MKKRLLWALPLAFAMASPAFAREGMMQRIRDRIAGGRVAIVSPHSVRIVNGSLRDIVAREKASLEAAVDQNKSAGRGAAFQHVVIPLPSGATISTVSLGRYGTSPHVDQSQVIRLTGFRGDVRAVHLGTMSVHDLKRGDGYDQATFEARLRDDRVGLEADGKPLLHTAPSGKVSSHEVTIPHGTIELHYLRQTADGRVVGNRYGYQMGRLLKVQWD